MPVPSQGHCIFSSFLVVDWFCLFVELWVLPFPLEDYSVFGNFVITLIWGERWLFLLLILAGFVTRVTRRVSQVEQELLTLQVFSGVRVARSFAFCVLFCRSLFVFLFYIFCPLCFKSFDFLILTTLLVSSNFSEWPFLVKLPFIKLT